MATYPNNYNQRPSITTNSIALFDEAGVMLKCGFLDGNISISFGSVKEEGGKRTYPNELRDNLLLSSERSSALFDIIQYKVLPAIESGTTYNGGVFTSNKKDNILEIQVITENNKSEIFLVFHRNIDENRKPSKSISFKFGKTPIIENYNTESGEFVLDEIDTHFFLFIKLLEGFLLCGVNNVTAHSYRNANRYTMDKIFKYLEEFAAKLGVTVANNSYNNFNNNNSGFNKSETEQTMPVMNELDSIESLMF